MPARSKLYLEFIRRCPINTFGGKPLFPVMAVGPTALCMLGNYSNMYMGANLHPEAGFTIEISFIITDFYQNKVPFSFSEK